MYGDLVPQEIQNELIAIRDANTLNGWRVGDLTLAVIEYNRANNTGALLQDIYSAVGLFAGRASRTIREFCYLAGFFPMEKRLRYDVLAIDHFREAARLGPELAYEALDWAVEQTDVWGRPATVDAMTARWQPEPPEEPDQPEEIQSSPYQFIRRTIDRQIGLAEAWAEMPDLGSLVVGMIRHYLDAARGLKATVEMEMEGQGEKV